MMQTFEEQMKILWRMLWMMHKLMPKKSAIELFKMLAAIL